MLGSLMMLASGVSDVAPQFGQVVVDPLALGQTLGERARIRPASEMSRVVDRDPRLGGVGLDHGEQRVRGQRGASSVWV